MDTEPAATLPPDGSAGPPSAAPNVESSGSATEASNSVRERRRL